MVRSLTVCLALLATLAGVPRAGAETLLVEFTSPTCGPCRSMRPILRSMAREGYAIREIDVTRDPAIATRYRVNSWPTFLVLVDGCERARLVGATSQAQLVEMVHKAAALAAGSANTVDGARAVVSPIGFDAGSGRPPTGAPTTFAQGPTDGRLVAIDQPKASSHPLRPRPGGAASAATDAAATATDLIAATVRLSIRDPGGKSTGTGTIVDARQGEALVLTCGHLFRESAGNGAIEVSLYKAGPHGAELVGTAEGVLLDYDLDRDLALVRFSASGPVKVARVAPPGSDLAPGTAVSSVGCDNGADPTVWPTQLTATNQSRANPLAYIAAAKSPVEGRSGGGLFDSSGQLVGICFAADPQSDEGLYASLPSIHAKLDALQLSFVYQTPSLGTEPAGRVALAAAEAPVTSAPATPSLAIRGQNPTESVPAPLPAAWGNTPTGDVASGGTATPTPVAEPPLAVATAPAPGPAAAELTPAERATLEEIRRAGAAAEVICIIRPLTPDGRSDVIKLSNASPALVRAITAAGVQAPAEAATAAASSAASGGFLR